MLEETMMNEKLTKTECQGKLLPVRDALEVLSGKWKLPILLQLGHGPRRFKELQRDIDSITAKMLSKELKDLEQNLLVTRKVYDTMPVSIEYSLTEYGSSIQPLLKTLYEWGSNHRSMIREHHQKKEAIPA